MPASDITGITAAGEHAYDVTIVDGAGTETHHRVQVLESFLQRHGLAASQEPTLVRASVLFLLEREPAGSIMATFTLDDIARYFPDYPAEVVNRL